MALTGEGGLPQVQRSSALFCRVAGTFYRGVNPQFAASALQGSVRPGRYSAEGQPTLYLSSSPEGVSAAMLAHHHDADSELELLRIRVEADSRSLTCAMSTPVVPPGSDSRTRYLTGNR